MIRKKTEKHNAFTETMVWLIIIITILIVMAMLLIGFIAYMVFDYHFYPLDPVFEIAPISGVLILILSGTFTWLNRLVTVLTDGIERVDNGDFSVRLDPSKGGPLANAYRNFNKMATELSKTANLQDDFINQFSHEFRTPITSIQGFADLMLHKDLPPKKQKEYLSLINQEAKRLTNLSNNVLQLTKLEAQQIIEKPVSFDLAEQVRQAAILFLPQLEAKKITPTIEIAPAQTIGDPALLQQVWLNLLSNACRFTPLQGHLGIKVHTAADQIQVSFTNDGPLIPQKQLNFLFDKFYQAPDSHNTNGLGLGLAIAKRIVDLHSGSISVTSTAALGTSFTVTLPLAK